MSKKAGRFGSDGLESTSCTSIGPAEGEWPAGRGGETGRGMREEGTGAGWGEASEEMAEAMAGMAESSMAGRAAEARVATVSIVETDMGKRRAISRY